MNPILLWMLAMALLVLSLVFAGVFLAEKWQTVFELYYGKVHELQEKLEKSQLQEQRGAENYQTLGEMYDRLADKYREQSTTVEQQAELIKSLRNKEPGQGLVEYAIQLVLIAVLVVLIVGGIGAAVYAFYVRFVGAVPWVY